MLQSRESNTGKYLPAAGTPLYQYPYFHLDIGTSTELIGLQETRTRESGAGEAKPDIPRRAGSTSAGPK